MIEDVPTPEPSASDVLVRIKAAGVNPVDIYLRSGKHAHAPQLPYTPGKDAAGIVEKIGHDVDNFKPGDRVYTADSKTGTYAEFALCTESQLGRLPDGIDFRAGAAIWTPYATAYRALFEKAAAKAGETVLVHGASGGVGIAAIQWAKKAGLRVIGTAGSDAGKELVSSHGADLVTGHLSGDATAKGQILEATGGAGVQIVVEMLANINLQLDLEILAMFGRISVVGNRGTLEFDPRALMGKDASVMGLSLFNAPAETRKFIHKEIYSALTDGAIKPVIGRSFSLAEAPLAHHAVLEDSAFGKIVLLP